MERKGKPSIVKETKEERLERLKLWPTTRTRIIPNKKKQSRAKRKEMIREFFSIFSNWEN